MLPDDPALGGEEAVQAGGDVPGGKLLGSLVVRGIEEDEVERFGGSGGNPIFHGGFEDGEVVVEGLQVVPQGFGGAVVVFDKEGGFRAAAPRGGGSLLRTWRAGLALR